MDQSPIKRAVAVAGSQGKLAAAIGTKQQNVWKWIKRGSVPAEFVLPIERATEGAVTRHELRPDIYPASDAAA
jgi:DNA-binding transcriptional regulator YdaS (Cro superfamily)